MLAGAPGELPLLELVEVKVLGRSLSRTAFSLLFHGPPDRALGQGLYHLANAEVGELELFMTPLGPAGDGLAYEAVFT